jgi:hypothetical protein
MKAFKIKGQPGFTHNSHIDFFLNRDIIKKLEDDSKPSSGQMEMSAPPFCDGRPAKRTRPHSPPFKSIFRHRPK